MNRRPPHEPSRQFRSRSGCGTMRPAMRHRWGARPAWNAVAAAASIPTPASSTAATCAPARTRPSATWFAGSIPACSWRGCAKFAARLRQCAAPPVKRRAQTATRRPVRRSSLRPRCCPRRTGRRAVALRGGQHGDRRSTSARVRSLLRGFYSRRARSRGQRCRQGWRRSSAGGS